MLGFRIDRTLYVVGAIALTAFVGYYILSVYEREIEAMPILGPVTEATDGTLSYHEVPAFRFTDQEGNPFTSDDLKGKIYVANYFFTSCPTICPTMSANLAELQRSISDMADVEILSFTVDPERDNPERLKNYAERFEAKGDQWHFLTGEKVDLYRLARNGFFLSATEGDGGPYDFIHSENFVLVDRGGRLRGFYDGTKTANIGQIINDIQKLRKSNS